MQPAYIAVQRRKFEPDPGYPLLNIRSIEQQPPEAGAMLLLAPGLHRVRVPLLFTLDRFINVNTRFDLLPSHGKPFHRYQRTAACSSPLNAACLLPALFPHKIAGVHQTMFAKSEAIAPPHYLLHERELSYIDETSSDGAPNDGATVRTTGYSRLH